MKLEDDLWIEGGYYVDFDILEQFRIIGPNNHLYCGLIDIPRHSITIKSVTAKEGGGVLIVKGAFTTRAVNLYYPIQEDIRTIRSISRHLHTGGDPGDQMGHPISFLQMRRGIGGPHEAAPMVVEKYLKGDPGHKGATQQLIFKRYYGEMWYGVTFSFPRTVPITSIDDPYKGFHLKAGRAKTIPFTIRAETNDLPPKRTCPLIPAHQFDVKKLKRIEECFTKLWKRSSDEIQHLICWGKTSGDRFGTVFPRDWMESAILGEGDIPPDVVDYMLEHSLKNINEEGQGWHEDVVGEYRYEHEVSGKDLFDRRMIDIEPLYFLALPLGSKGFCKKQVKVLGRVANYIVNRASEHTFITFKKIPARADDEKDGTKEDRYYTEGNWRDSAWAFKQIDPIIAPFDVNAVFYPRALEIIKEYNTDLHVDAKKLGAALKKWRDKKKAYEYQERDGNPAYALALYGKKFSRMEVAHLDLSYWYYFFDGEETEVQTFCNRLLSEKFFSTRGGPTLIAHQNTFGYTTQEYHGLVTWTKQVAFVVGALGRQYAYGKKQKWSTETLALIRKTIVRTAKQMLQVYHVLGHSFPELHISVDNKVRYFAAAQDVSNAFSSRVQLWSAVGARRILRELYTFL